MYSRLGKVYGKRRRVNFGTTFEQLILTILASESKEPQALKALSLLQERYVDWNEVRICPDDILQEDLRKAGVNSGAPVLLKRTLEGLLLELSTLRPEMLDDYTPQEVRVILDRIDLPRSLSASLLLTRSPSPESLKVPIDSGVARVMARAGFVKTARATNEIQRCIKMLLPEAEEHNFHRVAGRLSQDYCLAGDPKCARCPARHECRYCVIASSAGSRSPVPRKAARLRRAGVPRRSRPPSSKR